MVCWQMRGVSFSSGPEPRPTYLSAHNSSIRRRRIADLTAAMQAHQQYRAVAGTCCNVLRMKRTRTGMRHLRCGSTACTNQGQFRCCRLPCYARGAASISTSGFLMLQGPATWTLLIGPQHVAPRVLLLAYRLPCLSSLHSSHPTSPHQWSLLAEQCAC